MPLTIGQDCYTDMIRHAVREARNRLEHELSLHPKVFVGAVLLRTPLRVEGYLRDDRRFYFHCDHGVTSLSLAEPGGNAVLAPYASDRIQLDLNANLGPDTAMWAFSQLLTALDTQ